MKRDTLNYRGHTVLHIKKVGGFCQVGYYDDTLCGKRIITATGISGCGILWERGCSNMEKPMCKKCAFLKDKRDAQIIDYHVGNKKYPKSVLGRL